MEINRRIAEESFPIIWEVSARELVGELPHFEVLVERDEARKHDKQRRAVEVPHYDAIDEN